MKDNFKVKRKDRGGIEEAISVDFVNDIGVGRKVKKSEKKEGQTL